MLFIIIKCPSILTATVLLIFVIAIFIPSFFSTVNYTFYIDVVYILSFKIGLILSGSILSRGAHKLAIYIFRFDLPRFYVTFYKLVR